MDSDLDRCSCTYQLINIVEHLAKDMDSQKQIDMIFLDFSKAFDILYPINAYLQNYSITELIIKYILLNFGLKPLYTTCKKLYHKSTRRFEQN